MTSALQRRRRHQFLDGFDRADVGEQPERFAQSEQRLLGPFPALGLSHFGPPTAPSRIASLSCACLSDFVRQRGAGGVDRMTADHAFLELEIDRGSPRDDLENLQSLADDLGADAVTFQN